MSESKQRIAFAILEFLEEQRQEFKANGDEDSYNGLRVAQECISRSFGVPILEVSNPTSSLRMEKSLTELCSSELTQESSEDSEARRQAQIEESIKFKEEGNKCVATKNYQGAVEAYTKAINLHQDAKYFGNRAAAYTYLENYESALEDCNMAINLDPNYTKAYVRKGMVLSQMKKFQEAEDSYLKALELDPDNAGYKKSLQNAKEMRMKEESEAPEPASESQQPQSSNPLAGLMNNPMLMSMAQQVMQDPNMRNSFGQLASSFLGGGGGGEDGQAPDLSSLLSGLGGSGSSSNPPTEEEGNNNDNDDDNAQEANNN